MSQNASAPFWVKASLLAALSLMAIPAWLWSAGWVLWWLLFHGHAKAPTLMTWWDYYSAYRDVPAMHRPLLLSACAASAAVLAPLIIFLIKPKQSLHGEARFARLSEVRRAGLLTEAGDGLIVGKVGKRFLTASLDKYPHVLLAAPTGAGKGVGYVIPNLFNWNHSAIVLDVKQENWEITAGFRQAHGHTVFLFDPLSETRKTHRWNPLGYVSADPNLRIDDLQDIANILFPDIDNTDPIWTASCRSLFTGIALYLLETPGKSVTFGQIAREALGDDAKWKQIIEDRSKTSQPLTLKCRNDLFDFLNTADNTRTSIRKTFTSRFDLYTNPLVDAATSANDFDIGAVRKQRMTIYLGVAPGRLDRLAPLMNIFFQQVVNLNVRELPEHNPALKFQCLLLMDEFRSLGRMKILVTAIAFLRGYGLRLSPVFQSPSQVREAYGDDAAKNFFKNHALRISYTPADIDDATEVSRELGNFTFKSTSKSKPIGLGKGNPSQSTSDQSRAVLLPQEVKDLENDEVIIFAKGCKPIRAKKIFWYDDPVFKSRVLPAPEVPIAPFADTGVVSTAVFAPPELEDVATLKSRPFSDFLPDAALAKIVVPKGPCTSAAVDAVCDQFRAALSRMTPAVSV